MNLNHWISAFLATFGVIFAIIDPFGYIPIFLSITQNDSEQRRKQLLKRACIAAFITLTFFTFLGNYLLSFFGITMPALQISGGIILLIISFEMLKVIPVEEKISEKEETEATKKEDTSIIPLAIPMLAGPASIAGVIMLGGKKPYWMSHITILLSVFLTLCFTYLILRSATKIMNWIGITGLKVLTRIMGFLLCAMAIQFIINGWVAIKS